MGWFNKKNEPEEEAVPAPKPVKVKVLGVCTEVETRGAIDYYTTRYCLLVEHDDGSRDIYEYGRSHPEFLAMLHLIPMD